ncbi:hypothetical protein SKAU_G00223680 [Synaphobranchus kaupii]|uniref:Protein capicua homolog-like domain-containing protein n=1 Tax=Synaphobranchus kaupii TaxID=118154 RepID=A0A9Q1FBQ6_SYNKA|nr:hypothetical protein SKAU_G00223680 [Synaphobranchus kaupii]
MLTSSCRPRLLPCPHQPGDRPRLDLRPQRRSQSGVAEPPAGRARESRARGGRRIGRGPRTTGEAPKLGGPRSNSSSAASTGNSPNPSSNRKTATFKARVPKKKYTYEHCTGTGAALTPTHNSNHNNGRSGSGSGSSTGSQSAAPSAVASEDSTDADALSQSSGPAEDCSAGASQDKAGSCGVPGNEGLPAESERERGAEGDREGEGASSSGLKNQRVLARRWRRTWSGEEPEEDSRDRPGPPCPVFWPGVVRRVSGEQRTVGVQPNGEAALCHFPFKGGTNCDAVDLILDAPPPGSSSVAIGTRVCVPFGGGASEEGAGQLYREGVVSQVDPHPAVAFPYRVMLREDSEVLADRGAGEEERGRASAQAVWVSRQSLRLLIPPWDLPQPDGGREREWQDREREERERREEMEVEREVIQLSIGMALGGVGVGGSRLGCGFPPGSVAGRHFGSVPPSTSTGGLNSAQSLATDRERERERQMQKQPQTPEEDMEVSRFSMVPLASGAGGKPGGILQHRQILSKPPGYPSPHLSVVRGVGVPLGAHLIGGPQPPPAPALLGPEMGVGPPHLPPPASFSGLPHGQDALAGPHPDRQRPRGRLGLHLLLFLLFPLAHPTHRRPAEVQEGRRGVHPQRHPQEVQREAVEAALLARGLHEGVAAPRVLLPPPVHAHQGDGGRGPSGTGAGEAARAPSPPSDLRPGGGRASSEFDWDETSRDSSEASSRGGDSRPRLVLPSLLPQDFSRFDLEECEAATMLVSLGSSRSGTPSFSPVSNQSPFSPAPSPGTGGGAAPKLGTPGTERERHPSGILPSFHTNLTFTVPMSPNKRKEALLPPPPPTQDYPKAELEQGDPALGLNPTAAFRVLSPQTQPHTPTFSRPRGMTTPSSRPPSSSAAISPPPMLVSPTPPLAPAHGLRPAPRGARIPAAPCATRPSSCATPRCRWLSSRRGPWPGGGAGGGRGPAHARENSQAPQPTAGLQVPVPINGAATNGAVLLRSPASPLVLVSSASSLPPLTSGLPIQASPALACISVASPTASPSLTNSASGGRDRGGHGNSFGRSLQQPVPCHPSPTALLPLILPAESPAPRPPARTSSWAGQGQDGRSPGTGLGTTARTYQPSSLQLHRQSL